MLEEIRMVQDDPEDLLGTHRNIPSGASVWQANLGQAPRIKRSAETIYGIYRIPL